MSLWSVQAAISISVVALSVYFGWLGLFVITGRRVAWLRFLVRGFMGVFILCWSWTIIRVVAWLMGVE